MPKCIETLLRTFVEVGCAANALELLDKVGSSKKVGIEGTYL